MTFTSTVSPGVAGSVTFFDGVAILGTKPLNAGQVVLTTGLLSAGPHSVRAYYSGSSANTPSTSSSIAITVTTAPINRFLPPVIYGSGSASSVAIGDFNGDGKPDLVIITAGSVSVLLGKGDGTFQAGVNSAAGANPDFVAVGDFNGDGKADLAVTSSSGIVSILLGNGDGTFKATVSYAAGNNPSVVAVGDFNGDGNADLAISNGYVLFGNGDGTFQTAVQWLTNGILAVGDFNGDGKADFIDDTGAVLLGNNDGTFRTAGTVTGGEIVVADFNGDGKADVAVISHVYITYCCGFLPYSRDSLNVYVGKGDGTFQTPVTVASGAEGTYPGVLAVGDFNGDGKLDLALVSASVQVFLGNGDGTFGPEVSFGTSAGANGPVLASFAGDGKTDIVFTGSAGVGVLLGELLPTTVTTLQSSLNPSMYGQSVTFTATVTPSTATGSVSFYENGYPVATGTVALQNGQASITPAPLRLGSTSLVATYSGDANFLYSASAALTQSVIPATSAVTMTSSANPAVLGESLLLTATVSSPIATGTVVFNDGQTPLGTRTVSAGKAYLLISTLAAGAHSLTAAYSGDANDVAGTSSLLI